MYCILTVISFFSIIYAQETTVVDLSEFENSSEISMLRNISGPGYNNPKKQALRYGFQQTKDCKNFAKVYMCIRKCLDFNYDVAHSDRFCKCSCFMKLSKEKFTMPPVTNGTKWSAGAPTTTIFVTPKYPPTYEDEITSEPEDEYDTGDDKGSDKSDEKGDDNGDDNGDGKGDEARGQGGDLGDLKNSDGNDTSGLNPEGDGLITSADGDDSEIDGGGVGSAAEGGGESATDGGGEGDETKAAE